MSRLRIRSALVFILAASLVPVLLVLGAQKGAGQEKAAGSPKAARTGQEGTVDSHDRTNFPLIGKHRTLACRECHANLVFEGTPADCEVCHWERRRDDRYALRLGTGCADCHTPQSWKKVDPALWSHESNAGFRLEGAHRTLDCEDCHGSDGFAPRQTDCYACHESDYLGARDPNHTQSGFSTSCIECHDQRAWKDASFDHPFPIRSGRHAGVACAECHQTSDFRVFTCLGCHEQAETNGRHDEVTGYAYSSQACYACHPQGNR